MAEKHIFKYKSPDRIKIYLCDVILYSQEDYDLFIKDINDKKVICGYKIKLNIMQDPYPLIIEKKFWEDQLQKSHEEVYIKNFYKNWYFYQQYKNKEHYKDSHKIKYE